MTSSREVWKLTRLSESNTDKTDNQALGQVRIWRFANMQEATGQTTRGLCIPNGRADILYSFCQESISARLQTVCGTHDASRLVHQFSGHRPRNKKARQTSHGRFPCTTISRFFTRRNWHAFCQNYECSSKMKLRVAG